MAIMGNPLRVQRPEYSTNAYMAYPWKGHICARGWPEHRKRRPDTAQKLRQEWLTNMVAEYKRTAGPTVANVRYCANLSRERPQDYWMHCQAGREWLILHRDGTRLYPYAFLWLLSQAIDQACAAPAALACRARDEWRPLPGGDTGSQLTYTPAGPAWSDGTGVIMDTPNTRASSGVSLDLDTITRHPGALMVRGELVWEPIPPGQPGDVLTINEDRMPEWKPPQ